MVKIFSLEAGVLLKNMQLNVLARPLVGIVAIQTLVQALPCFKLCDVIGSHRLFLYSIVCIMTT